MCVCMWKIEKCVCVYVCEEKGSVCVDKGSVCVCVCVYVCGK